MGKILILGDIHGRTIWKDIIKKENPDKIIFLGDYVSTHEGISSEQQISNLEEILSYKEDNLDKVILLRGNHDTQHLGYYWAQCSNYDNYVASKMSSGEFLLRFTKLTGWVYVDDHLKTIFSHAGVSKVWMDTILKESDIHNINDYGMREEFGFTPNWRGDCYGNSTTQPPTWIRPETLCDCNYPEWNQIVGHTPVRKNIVNIGKIENLKESIWLCDALGIKQYLIIDNDKVIPRSLEQ